MFSFKRFSYIVLMVIALGCIFLLFSIHESRPASVQLQISLPPEREWLDAVQVDEGEKPSVFILGNSEDGHYGEIYSNVRQLCEDIHLTIAGEGRLDMGKVTANDLVICCDASVESYADLAELEKFMTEGGRVILAAGLGEADEDSGLWPALGIQEKSPGEDYHELVFERPLLPLQPEQAYYDGSSGSARIEVSADAAVYIRDSNSGVPLLYTNAWGKGGVCLMNGTFLKDARCMGLLTGAMTALMPDFVYPVLGVKAVFLDNFPIVTSADDELCRRVYGYSTEGFVQEVVWPTFQGISLRTDTPYTAGILAAASSEERFGTVDDELLAAVGKSVLQFGGELIYVADCPEDGKVMFHRELLDRFSRIFPGYTVQGLAMNADKFTPELLDVPGAEILSVRGMLGSRETRLSREDGRTVFPAATAGNAMEDGNLFSICSVLGAYGMISHVFDADMLIARDGETAAWDLCKRQIGLFESEILARAPWLEGRTLTQTGDDVRSYQDMNYGYEKSIGRMELTCSGAAKGQAFFYHTEGRIISAEGLTYQAVGNGYYLLRMQENRGIITLEEGT